MSYKLYTHPKYSFVHIVEIPFSDIEKIDLALCNQPTETPDAYYKRQAVKPDIITNGGFFGMANGVTVFSFVDEGQTISTSDYPGVGIRGEKELVYLNEYHQSFRDFITAYPAFIVRGKPVQITYATSKDYDARRTCIGWNKDKYFVVTIDAPGLRYDPIKQIFLELDAEYAINLDGGGSTRMLVEGKRITSESYARPVDNVMCVYLKKEEPAPEPVWYRVQVGAFMVKKYAEGFLKQIQSDGYPDAYIKKIGLYYKVQVGAFRIKLNAERMRDELRGKGYKDAFITTNK